MYDFWYSLGVTIIRPALLDFLEPFAEFQFVKRTVTDQPLHGGSSETRTGPSAGWLIQRPTENIRLLLAQLIRAYSHDAPPVSIYAAGRFSQLLSIREFQTGNNQSSFRSIVQGFHHAYLVAVDGHKESTLPSFPALLGAIAMDAQLARALASPNLKLQMILSEFNVCIDDTNLEWRIAKKFAESPRFCDSVALFQESQGDANPWNDGGTTFEQVYWWPSKSKYAIP